MHAHAGEEVETPIVFSGNVPASVFVQLASVALDIFEEVGTPRNVSACVLFILGVQSGRTVRWLICMSKHVHVMVIVVPCRGVVPSWHSLLDSRHRRSRGSL